MWLLLPKIHWMHRRLLIVFLALALASGPVVAGHAATPVKTPTTASKKATKDARTQELRELVGEASEQEGALLEEIATIRERLSELTEAVRTLDRDVASARRRLSAAERDLARANAKQIEIGFRLVETQALVEAARQAMNVTISALYQQGQSEHQALYAAIVETSTSPHQVFTAARYLEGTIKGHRADLDRFVALKAEAEALAREAAARAEEARLARDEIVSDRQRLEGLRAEAVAARTAARAEEDREQELLREVQERKTEFLRELGLLQAESSAIGQMLRTVQAGQKLAPRRKGTFKRPVDAPMSSRFGPRVHPIFGDTRVHTGLDFSVGAGVPIRAAGNGFVLWAGPRGGYGNLVIVDHGNGLATLYAHQSHIDVLVGNKVKTGQVIGYVGSTGFSTGPHLHFETREFGTPADPLLYL